MATFADGIEQYCRPGSGAVVLDHLGRFDAQAIAALSALFAPQEGLAPAVLCRRAIVGELAGAIRRDAGPDYSRFLLAEAWAVHGRLAAHPEGGQYLDADFTGAVRRIYETVPWGPPPGPGDHARIWFGCARAFRIDIRAAVAPFIAWDWRFGEDFGFSETWQHARYLAAFNDEHALAAISDKLDTVAGANLLLALLRDLAEVRTEALRGIVARFADDPRPTDSGIESLPPIPLGQEVRNLLARW